MQVHHDATRHIVLLQLLRNEHVYSTFACLARVDLRPEPILVWKDIQREADRIN